MASEKKLDCVILGLLSHEELTGYEIKKRIDSALRHFWGASYGSIYPTLQELVRKGYARHRQEESARRRVIYSITDKGRERLAGWLAKPAQQDEVRYETLLKLFFGGAGSPEHTLAHIEAFEHRTVQALTSLEQARAALQSAPGEDAHRHYLLTVEFGIKTYTAQLEWCAAAKAALKGE